MAVRLRALHMLVFGLIGVLLIWYSSYYTSPVSFYHVELKYENTTINSTKSAGGAIDKVVSKPNNTPASVVQQIPMKPADNQTTDKTAQGILTESIYESGHDIPNAELCPELGSRLKVLVGVMSAPAHQEARMAIRQTWGHFALRRDVSIGFIVGNAKEASSNTITNQESVTYGDVVRANFVDSYDNLTLKTISFLEWIDSYCPRAKYILKTDDDMFINFPKLLSFIDKHWNDERIVFGRLAKKWKPIRNSRSKYYVSLKQFSPSVFPDFTTGPAYLFTGDIVRDMYKHALNHTYLKLEDVFTTGIVAQSINVKRVHINEFLNKRIPFNVCNIKKSISIHMVKFHEQFDLWKKLLDGKSKCK